MSGSRRRRGIDEGPMPLGASLDRVVQRLHPPAAPGGSEAPPARALGALFSRWEEIVGPGMARHVQPVELVRGTLVVAADLPVWAAQVRLLGTSLLERVGEVCGVVPEQLRVTVRRPLAGGSTHSGDTGFR